MKQALLLTILMVVTLGVAEGHLYRDHWMNSEKIDPDYMHQKAMSSWSRSVVLEEKIKVDDISSKQAVEAIGDIDFGGMLKIILPNSQRFAYGFINGTRTLGSASICSSALLNVIDYAFKLVDVRFVWLPQYSIKFSQT